MSCRPDTIIRDSRLKERVHFKSGDTADIITVILDTDAISDQYINADAAQCLKGETDYETLYNVWDFVKSNIRYRADKRGLEVIKSPGALFKMGRGDCKSFSIAVVALLRALGFRGIRYRFTAYDGNPDFTHVYVVCKSRGRDVILDAVFGQFDAEDPRWTKRKDIPAAKPHLSGIRGVNAQESGGGLFKILLVSGLFIWALKTWK